MIIKKYYTLLSLFLIIGLFVSCKKAKKPENIVESKTASNEYLISGTLKNIEDSTWIYINQDNKIVDSTQIIGEKFEFTGSVEEPSSFFMMVGKTNPEYFVLWAENLIITVEGEKGNLKNTTISAGKTQKEREILTKRTDKINQALNFIEKKYGYTDIPRESIDSVVKAQNKLLSEMEQISKGFIREFPDSYVSVNSLNIYNTTWDKKVVAELYDNLSDKMKSSKNGLEIKQFLSLPGTPKIGEKYIDFKLPNATGELIKLSEIKGKYILVEFWASWCGPCIEANPKLVKTYNKYKDQGFEIIGVSLDNNKEYWLKAIEKDQLPWVNVSDLKGGKTEVAQIYGINGIPDNFLIDEEGKIIAKTLRGNQLENKLKELF
ncbi:redoxin domain-containing protein [Aquimarina sp. SS2-1]|uniref:redoxin domain-containing protein n=1 Tax=Aquimarina besae TaxID=3342247 RepID=UPI00366BF3EB